MTADTDPACSCRIQPATLKIGKIDQMPVEVGSHLTMHRANG